MSADGRHQVFCFIILTFLYLAFLYFFVVRSKLLYVCCIESKKEPRKHGFLLVEK